MFQALSCFFYLCSAENGGGMFCDSTIINGYIADCSFQNCSANKRGGGIAIFNAASFNMTNCCFLENSAWGGASYIMWSDYQILLVSSCNLTSDAYSSQTYHGPTLGGRNSFFAKCNNISDSYAATRQSGMLILVVPNTTIMSCTLSVNGNGLYVWSLESHSSPGVTLCNTINNTVANGYPILQMLTNTAVTFTDCVFLGNTVTKVFGDSMTEASGTLTMIGCLFDFASANGDMGNITQSGCSFGACSSNLISFPTINFLVCNPCRTYAFTQALSSYFALFSVAIIGVLLVAVMEVD